MVFIVGLGNPGPEYTETRHNAGWMMLDAMAQNFNVPPFTYQKKLLAEVAKKDDVIWIKPQTFMNLSGQAVRAAFDFYHQPVDQSGLKKLIVVHDDLDLELGNYKIQLGTGPKIHNGLLSLYQHLGSQAFWHVRVGVDDRGGDRSVPGSSYVLQKFSPDQKTVLLEQAENIVPQLRQYLEL